MTFQPSRLVAQWKWALTVSNNTRGYIGIIPYALILRVVALVTIAARALSFDYADIGTPLLVGFLSGMLVVVVASVSKSIGRGARLAIIAVDTTLVFCTYALSEHPRSDTYILFGLPLLIAAGECKLRDAAFVFVLVNSAFASALYLLQSEAGQLSQFGAIFLPRSAIFAVLMAGWASAVRSLRTRTSQLADLTEFNKDLTTLSGAPQIIVAASIAVRALTGAEQACVILLEEARSTKPTSATLLGMLHPSDRERLLTLIEEPETPRTDCRIDTLRGAAPNQQLTVVLAPLFVGSRNLGALLLADSSARHFRLPFVSDTVLAVAGQTAAALERHRISKLWSAVVDALSREAGRLTETTVTLNSVLDDLLRQIAKLNFSYVALSIVDEYRDRVEMLRGLNVPPGWIRRSQYTLVSDDIIAYVVRTADTVISEGWDDRFNREIFDRFEHQKLVRVFCPICCEGRPIGVVEAGAPRTASARQNTKESAGRIRDLCDEAAERIRSHLPQGVLKEIADIATHLFGACAAYITVGTSDEAILSSGAGLATASFVQAHSSELAALRTKATSDSQLSTVLSEVPLRSQCPGLYGVGIRTIAVFAISLRRPDATGSLFLAFSTPYGFTDTDSEIARVFLGQLELVVKNYVHLTELRAAEDRAWSLSRLQTVMQTMTARFDLADLLSGIAQDLLHMLDADLVVIYEYQQNTASFLPAVTRGFLIYPDQMRGRLNPSSGVGTLVRLEAPIYAEDVQSHPALRQYTRPDIEGFAQREGIVSTVVVPLRTEDPAEIVGLAFVNYRSKRLFTVEDTQAIAALTSSAAIAILTARERVRAEHSLARLERELSAVGAADSAVLSGRPALSRPHVLALLLRTACDVTEGTWGGILWLEGSRFRPVSVAGAQQTVSPELAEVPLTDELARHLDATRRAYLVGDLLHRPGPSRQLLSRQARSQIAVPLIDSERMVAIMVIEHQNLAQFRPEDKRFLDAIALQARMILQAQAFYEHLQAEIRPQRALTLIATRIQNASHTLDTQLRLLLTGVTARQGLAFSRAMIFTLNEEGMLKGLCAVGALSRDEAMTTWQRIEMTDLPEEAGLVRLLDDAERIDHPTQATRELGPLPSRIANLSVSFDECGSAIRDSIEYKKLQVREADHGDSWRTILESHGVDAPFTFVCCPLEWEKQTLGVLVVDDRFLPSERDQISSTRIDSLSSFVDMISLVILNSRLRERSRADALRDVQHQLRTPLTSAVMIADQLRTKVTQATRHDVERLEVLLVKAVRISHSVRLFADLAAGRPVRKTDIVRLTGKRISDVLVSADRQGRLQRRGLTVRIDTESLAVFDEASVKFDSVLLDQVVGNIIDNIYKYSFAEREAIIQARLSDREVVLCFENSGELSAAEAAVCTQREWRGERAREVTGEGSGLGLWIVDQVMKAHRGSVLVTAGGGGMVRTELTFKGEESECVS